jgi:hypothetical protein
MGGQPQAPRVVYQGPSQSDIAASQASLDQFRQQVTDQNTAFQAQLQQQIDAANQQTADLRAQVGADTAAASAAAASQQTTAYASAQGTAPESVETTEAVTTKEKPVSNLRISLAGTPSTAGTGLNIGV